MVESNPTVAQEIAHAASAFDYRTTGHAPRSVTVVLGEDTLVVTLHGALAPAEQALFRKAADGVQVQEFYRQLFAATSHLLRQEIKRITGVGVREAAVEVEPTTGAVVKVLTTGTVVQVFLLDGKVPAGSWSGSA